ncbi:MAG: hypothetical protein C0521_12340 [Xanthomonas sp.]|nr:hypothetical protein [Xanthomonas sp.]
MKKHLIATALFALLLPTALHAAANFAQSPHAIRQTYADGSATELACDARRAPPSCTFKTMSAESTRSYVIDLDRIDLQIRLSEYWFWPHAGEREDGLTIAIPVTCSEQDLALLEPRHRDHAECRAVLESAGDEFRPTRVEIASLLEPHVRQDRALR